MTPTINKLKQIIVTMWPQIVLYLVTSTGLYCWAYMGGSFLLYLFLAGSTIYTDYYLHRIKPIEKQLLRRPLEEKDFRQLPTYLRPTWTCHPSIEQVRWFNTFVKHVWPYFRRDLEPKLKAQITEALRGSKPAQIRDIYMSNFSFGEYPLVIEGVEHAIPRNDAYWLDLHVKFGGDVDAELCVQLFGQTGFHVNLDDLLIKGTLRIIFEPLVPKAPWFQSIHLSFVQAPKIEFDLSALSHRLDFLRTIGLTSILQRLVEKDALAFMVSPNTTSIEVLSEESLQPPLSEAEEFAKSLKGMISVRIRQVTLSEASARTRLLALGKSEDDAICDDLMLSLTLGQQSNSNCIKSSIFSPNMQLSEEFSDNFRFVISADDLSTAFLQINVHKRSKHRFGGFEEKLLGIAVVGLVNILSDGHKKQKKPFGIPLSTFPELTLLFDVEYRPFFEPISFPNESDKVTMTPGELVGPHLKAPETPPVLPASPISEASYDSDSFSSPPSKSHRRIPQTPKNMTNGNKEDTNVQDTDTIADGNDNTTSFDGGENEKHHAHTGFTYARIRQRRTRIHDISDLEPATPKRQTGATIPHHIPSEHKRSISMLSTYGGFLVVTVLKAKDLDNTDFVRSSDPYVSVRVGNQEQRTITQMNTLDPVWNETFQFYVEDFRSQTVTFTVRDKDMVTADEDLGSLAYHIEELMSCDNQSLTGEFRLEGSRKGTLTLSLVFKRFQQDI